MSLATNPDMFFSWVLLNSQTINPLTNPPPTTYPATHQPPIHRPTESIIIFERLDIRYILISQNTTGKTRKYTSVYYSKSPLFSITNIRRGQLYLLFQFLNFNTLLLPRYFKVTFQAGIFFSVLSVSFMKKWTYQSCYLQYQLNLLEVQVSHILKLNTGSITDSVTKFFTTIYSKDLKFN